MFSVLSKMTKRATEVDCRLNSANRLFNGFRFGVQKDILYIIFRFSKYLLIVGVLVLKKQKTKDLLDLHNLN